MKKNHSIRFRIFVRFLAVVTAGLISWCILAFVLSRTNMLNQSRESSVEAFKLVRDMYDFNPIMKELTLGDKIDEEEIKTARLRLRCICGAFKMRHMYLFRTDIMSGERTLYLSVTPEDKPDDEAINSYNSFQESLTDKISVEEIVAMSGITPDEPAILSGSNDEKYIWFTPVLDNNGNVDMLIGMSFDTTHVESKLLRITLILLIPIAAMLFLILLLLMLFVKKIVIKPLSIVSESMSLFVEDYSQEIPPLTDTLNPQGEIREITSSYDTMKTDIVKLIDDIRAFSEEKAKQDALDKITEQIQKGIMPSKKELKGENFEAYASAESAKSVGGDFYDCFTRNDGSVCVVMGDVSGKGIAAALFMAMTKTMIREHLIMGESPATVLNYVNDDISESNPENMFATVFAMVLNPADGTVTYANAGHTHPIVFSVMPATQAGFAEFLKTESGMAIGLFPDAEIVDETMTLTASQGILLYTDGITEAVNIDKKFFGEDRLLFAMNELLTSPENLSNGNTATGIVKKIISDVKQFEEGCDPFDDITVLALYSSSKR
ncbi:MAG: serine/threonine-protein phosphatase [Eubacterium sp.]|nr:serine/threonine-protein phosphatase [Eubacterium sp.]